MGGVGGVNVHFAYYNVHFAYYNVHFDTYSSCLELREVQARTDYRSVSRIVCRS